MIILGIDPGLADTGWGVIEVKARKANYLAHGSINTASSDLLERRIFTIYQQLDDLINRYKPACAAIETLYFSKNISSAMPVAHVRGAILLLLAQQSLDIKAFAPNTIKQAVTGSGASGKKDIQRMVQLLLGLKELPQPNHAADALAAALCYANGGTATSMA